MKIAGTKERQIKWVGQKRLVGLEDHADSKSVKLPKLKMNKSKIG